MRHGPSPRLMRRLKSLLAGGLSAALVLLSPGTECWAQAQSASQSQSGTAVPVPGALGTVGAVPLQAAPLSPLLVQPGLPGGPLALPALPTPAAAPQTHAAGVQAVPAALPASVLSQPAVAARSLNVPVSAAAPVLRQDSGRTLSGVEGAAAPSAAASAGEALESGAKELSKSPAASRGAVLDRFFSGARARSEGADPVVEARTPARAALLLKAASAPRALLDAGRAAPAGAEDAGISSVKVFITRAGREPVALTLGTLGKALDADPALRETLNAVGRVRFAVSKDNPHGGLREADVERLEGALKAQGVSVRIEVENVPVDWARQAERETGGEQAGGAQEGAPRAERGRAWRWFLGPITAPFREAVYLVRTLVASYTTPTVKEVVGGLISKALPSVLAVGAWTTALAGHPFAIAAAIGVSLGLNIFHGFWINTWSNFQNNIGKQRGLQYQTIFNLAYGQWWGALFRYISWTVVPNTVPPWALGYWKDMGIATIVGTFFGTLGIQGLNTLYDNGRLTRFQRGAIQQLRDLVMTLGGVFFGSGSMVMFWTMFAVQQGLDLAIYALSRRAQRRPILYVADESLAATPEFQNAYPVRPGQVEQESPLRQAWKMLLGTPFVKPVVWLIRKIVTALKKKV